jgi:hypothetical protein
MSDGGTGESRRGIQCGGVLEAVENNRMSMSKKKWKPGVYSGSLGTSDQSLTGPRCILENYERYKTTMRVRERMNEESNLRATCSVDDKK